MSTGQLLAVTFQGIPVPGWLVLGALAWLSYKLILIAVFPWAPCPKCDGRGRFFNGKFWKPCSRCGGNGRRLRLGRRVSQWVAGGK